jgi:hypothetical protein
MDKYPTRASVFGGFRARSFRTGRDNGRSILSFSVVPGGLLYGFHEERHGA